ncbi:MAG: hypothetical protein ACI9H8_001083 [Lysobacterales bacterium]|jgi:hypothetical protein
MFFLVALFAASALLMPASSQAQASLPTVRDVAFLVSAPDTREETLLRLTAIANFLNMSGADARSDTGQIKDDIEWVKRLRARHGKLTLRSPVLDPAAWVIRLELEQHQLESSSLVSPLGPGLDIYLDQVFDRSSEHLASVILPELLWQTEPGSTRIWSEFLEQLAADEQLKTAVLDASTVWLADWTGASGVELNIKPSDLFSNILASLDEMVQNAIAFGPPDPERLQKIRFNLLSSLPDLDANGQQQAAALLRLANLIDGLHERRYFSVAEGLLAFASSLLEQEADQNQMIVSGWLSKNIPLISTHFAKNFSDVDPRLNSALAAAFNVVQSVLRTGSKSSNDLVLHTELANTTAQLALLIPDLNYYFDLPVRDSIAGGMDACIGIMAMREDDGSPAMTRDLFDDCQQTLVDLADREARAAALSGDVNGPFGDNELERELSVTSGQRINYGIGYLHDRYSTGCAQPARPLPNSLEWSVLASLLAWFAEQSPVYFQTPENEARLARMRRIGQEFLTVVAEQVDCFAGAGAIISDPISRSLVDYRNALVALSSGINGVVFDLRGKLLSEGADVALQRDASQSTAYRPDKLLIGPCDQEKVCEMTAQLSSTRALLGLFPDEYLIADQTGLGKVDICYEEMAWIDRRSEPVRADDTNVANYFGRLEFKLKGRYQNRETGLDVFGFRFTSPNEHHYLFAAATQEVLDDECPVEWIGKMIVTPIRNDRGVVPNRLTYLAAPRMLPSRLLSNNWDRGAEWRDWFITGIGVTGLEDILPADISSQVNQQLKNLHRAEQAAIFQSILRPPNRDESLGIESLYEEMLRLTTVKSLIRHQFMLFYPQLINESDELRSAIAGHGGLLDSEVLSRFRSDNIPVSSLNGIAFERLEHIQQEWQKQPEVVRRTGSIASSLAHAMMRLNALHQKFFAEPVSVIVPDLEEPGA